MLPAMSGRCRSDGYGARRRTLNARPATKHARRLRCSASSTDSPKPPSRDEENRLGISDVLGVVQLGTLTAAGVSTVQARVAMQQASTPPSHELIATNNAILAMCGAAAVATVRGALRHRDADEPEYTRGTARDGNKHTKLAERALNTATRVGTRLRLHRRGARAEAAAMRAEINSLALRNQAAEDALRRLAEEARASQRTMDEISKAQTRMVELVASNAPKTARAQRLETKVIPATEDESP
ncbi:hypothetical protein RI054_19g85760 [Pseudoscourfieldia marina]